MKILSLSFNLNAKKHMVHILHASLEEVRCSAKLVHVEELVGPAAIGAGKHPLLSICSGQDGSFCTPCGRSFGSLLYAEGSCIVDDRLTSSIDH